MKTKEQLKKQAEYYKDMYLRGYMTKESALEMIEPYLNLVNRDINHISRAYGRYIKEMNFEDFINNS